MKTEWRQFTTEADALRFLNSSAIKLPIPRLVDSIALDGKTYTIMTRMPGRLLRDEFNQLSDSERRTIMDDIRIVLYRLWAIKQNAAADGKVMLSASGDDLPDPLSMFLR